MVITFKAPFSGLAPAWYKNSNSQIGNANHIGNMQNCNLQDPNCISNGPALTGIGTVTELIHYIADYTILSAGSTYGISNTKLWKFSNTTSTDDHTITSAVGTGSGNSTVLLDGNLYYIYNTTTSTTTGCNIGKYNLASTYTDAFGSTSDATGIRQTAGHPVAKISNTNTVLAVFGNGQYLGTINPTGVDFNVINFGAGTEIVDIKAHAGKFWVAVNTPNITGQKGQAIIYVFSPDFATSTDPESFINVGGKISSLFVDNGTIYVFHKDETATQYHLSVVNGSGLAFVAEFNGGLPNFAQVTKWEDFLLFTAGQQIWAAGASAKGLDMIAFQLTTNTYTTSGALATPMGIVMSASTQSTSYVLSKFSGYLSTSWFETINFQLSDVNSKGRLEQVVIVTEPLVANQSFETILKVNNSTDSSRTKTFNTLGYARHYFPVGANDIDDIRIKIQCKDTNLLKVRSISFLYTTYGSI